MLFQHSAILASLATVTLVASFEFVPNPGKCSDSSQQCIPISKCASFQTRAQVLRRRPVVCGFSSGGVKVCCDSETEQLISTTPFPLPQQCGEPRSAADFASTETTPTNPARRRRSMLVENIPPPPPNLEPHRSHVAPVTTATPHLVPTENIWIHIEPSIIVGGDTVELFEAPPAFAFNVGDDMNAGASGHRWPWMVVFGRWTEAGLGNWFCGGTLITDQHVLTAAHCFRPEEASAIGVRIADHDLTISSEVEHQERNLSSMVRHPDYLGSQNDLAVVRLAEPVQRTFAVQPICLPQAAPAGTEDIGLDVQAAGWGLLEFGGDAPDVLQEVELRITDSADCETSYRRLPQFDSSFPGGFQGTKVCAGSRDGEPRDSCRGDSGGPLMALTDGSYQLVGVVSTGVGCGHPEFPGLYTKVSAYIDWIVSQLT